MREACVIAIYRLSDGLARDIKAQGMVALPALSSGARASDRNIYGPWVETRENDGANDGQRLGGCSSSPEIEYLNDDVSAALARSGAYYSSTQHQEGMLVVAPSERLVGFYYAG